MSKKAFTSLDSKTIDPNTLPPAGFFTLLGCWLYDFMLLCAVWLLAGMVYMIPAQMFTQVDSSLKDNLSTTEFTGPVFYSYLFFVSWFFFACFWTHGGQTLGLRTWSLRLQTEDGYALNWLQTFLRFLIAGTPWLISLFVFEQVITNELLQPPYQYGVFIIGFIGLFWMLFDKENRSLQDIFSHTRIVKLPKKSKKRNKLY
ncbi:MAG: RDD family protein [gamma proteobacterium symbiont of Bathyaustriella thionipta]|nr:RDD family protein [gamma proteobacterium symbiont of Bathyaustriella thionipta]MCU7949689.1 RDD family protein [gamma proteobacterium symbiont of Bathyaustriella thionipta]MCU7952057.1 RDD family protein [gamma proteobacterium symbiont of Bathyaustriella thionipta]MCU7956277.1 RDD family protein [gamma proteobacterium symbiont of Bathyaustriella thionipta]MCU7968409.1 RDD family protein [gamma proteobacterium symbiont of Bathyaustriella thionipta]